MFIIYINDLIESCGDDAKIYLFADNARLYNHIKCIVDAGILQSKNDKFTDWAHRWLVKLSTKKCKSVSFYQRHYDTTTNSFTYKIDGVPLQHVDRAVASILRLGVLNKAVPPNRAEGAEGVGCGEGVSPSPQGEGSPRKFLIF